jgi:hypothetical protein
VRSSSSSSSSSHACSFIRWHAIGR